MRGRCREALSLRRDFRRFLRLHHVADREQNKADLNALDHIADAMRRALISVGRENLALSA